MDQTQRVAYSTIGQEVGNYVNEHGMLQLLNNPTIVLWLPKMHYHRIAQKASRDPLNAWRDLGEIAVQQGKLRCFVLATRDMYPDTLRSIVDTHIDLFKDVC
jgi:hypothetical protein